MIRVTNLQNEISVEILSERKKKLEEQALERFLDFQAESHCAPKDSPMLYSRKNTLESQDSIAIE